MIEAASAFPELASERLRLVCPATPGFDATAAYLAEGRPRFIDQHPDPEAAWWSIATIIGHWHLRGFGHFAVLEKDSGRHVGLVGPWHPRGWPEPELSWQLLEGAEGHGYATEASRCVLDWLFQDLGWASCVSLVDPGNDRSTAMVERLGARAEGVFSHRITGELRIWRHLPRTAPGRRLLEGLA